MKPEDSRETPRTVANRRDIKRSALESHKIDFDSFRRGNWTEFSQSRMDALPELAVEAVDPT